MYLTRARDIRHIGFVSTRLKGTDGVSLETEKWATVLGRMGYECFYYCGLSDRPADHTLVVDEAYFGHPDVAALETLCFGTTERDEEISGEIHYLRQLLKKTLYSFIVDFRIDLLVVENALSIPMNIPLGLAITEVIAETGIPVIGHHHDFPWERQRYLMSGVDDYLDMAFPPRLHSINHVVINTEAREQLGHRRGLSSTIIPNVYDFSAQPRGIDDYNRTLRSDLGLQDGDYLFLQPTRIIARKGIEHAIELVSRLPERRVKLLVSHQERDEGSDYYKRIVDYAKFLDVDLVSGSPILGTARGRGPGGEKVYDLWDCYANADLVTYPSAFEGFGNAFLEAIFYKKPIMVNRYSIFQSDIEPIGFKTALMDTYITDETVRHVRRFLDEPALRNEATERNFNLGKKYFSYELLEQRLRNVIMNFGVVG